MENNFKEKTEELIERTEGFVTQSTKRKKLVPWLIVAVLFAVTIVLLRVTLSAHEKQKELEDSLSNQQEMLAKMNDRLQEAEDALNSISVISSDTIREQLNSLQQLVTQEYIYTNADKGGGNDTWIFGWKRPFSGKSFVITYDGSIKAGIDLSKIQISVNESAKKVTVTLPKSTITDNNIPQETIKVIEVKDGLFNEVTLEDYNAFVVKQKAAMEQKAIDQGLLTKADEQAKETVKAFLSLIPGMDNYKLEVK